MNRKQHVRVFHITLVTLMILAFISGDFGVVQDILGYGVAAIIALRLLWLLLNPCQLCLNRFYPDFTRLRFDRWRRHLCVNRQPPHGDIRSALGHIQACYVVHLELRPSALSTRTVFHTTQTWGKN